MAAPTQAVILLLHQTAAALPVALRSELAATPLVNPVVLGGVVLLGVWAVVQALERLEQTRTAAAVCGHQQTCLLIRCWPR